MEAKNRTVDVIVEAKNLYTSPPADPWVDKYTSLEDDEGYASTFGEPNSNFETGVYKGYNITWVIKTANPKGEDKGYDVKLNSVYHNPTKGNPNFFDSEELYPRGNPKEITGTITREATGEIKSDTYTIYFAIADEKGNWQNYPLDPKLQIRRPSS